MNGKWAFVALLSIVFAASLLFIACATTSPSQVPTSLAGECEERLSGVWTWKPTGEYYGMKELSFDFDVQRWIVTVTRICKDSGCMSSTTTSGFRILKCENNRMKIIILGNKEKGLHDAETTIKFMDNNRITFSVYGPNKIYVKKY